MSTPSGSPLRRQSPIDGITGLRFLPHNTPASLVNLSPTGLLADSIGKLTVGSAATLAIDGGFSPSTVTGRVVRCEVAAMGRDGQLRYHLAIEFDRPLTVQQEPAIEPPPAPPRIRNRW